MTEAIEGVLARGGWVAQVLVVICLLLWTIATLRGFALRRGFRGALVELVRARLRAPASREVAAHEAIVVRFVARARQALSLPGACGHDLDRWAVHELDRTQSHAALLNSLVVAAPLLGLLGTVDGMIETFASLHGAGDHATEQSVAGGISLALVTTQMGLAIGIPGSIVARLLDRLAAARRRELFAARSLLAEQLGVEGS